jgi:ATP dependent DNA ligase domain
MLRVSTLPAGFIAPRLPTKTDKLPSGSQWLHEIKHDGFRVIARKESDRVRLCSRPGNDMTRRFPLIVDALVRLRSRSCIIDGEAVACDENGVASFDLVRHHRANDSVFRYAFDLDTRTLKDPSGKAYGQEVFAAAQKPEGQITEVSYMAPKPGTTAPAVPKVTFVTRVNDLVCGVGYYK